MPEKVVIGNAELWHGDCFEVLDELAPHTVDLLLTDPPYAAAAATVVTGFAKDTWGRNWADMSIVKLMAQKIYGAACLKPEHAGYWFCDHLTHAALLPQLFGRYPLVQTIVWDKDMLGVGGSYRKQTELVLYTKTTRGPQVGTSERDLIRLRPNYSSKQHPAEKPLELVRKLADASEWQTCLDPFMGGGTTGVAALQLGRKFVGIELERKYFDIACERIENEQRQCRSAV